MEFKETKLKVILSATFGVLVFILLQFSSFMMVCNLLYVQNGVFADYSSLCGPYFPIYTNLIFGFLGALIFYIIYSLFQRK
ncbi:MAG: hypothetical protein Q8Q04_03185 [archaeon]|nr:hypothetical protein [archaeon]